MMRGDGLQDASWQELEEWYIARRDVFRRRRRAITAVPDLDDDEDSTVAPREGATVEDHHVDREDEARDASCVDATSCSPTAG
jgi:hypothetical protein